MPSMEVQECPVFELQRGQTHKHKHTHTERNFSKLVTLQKREGQLVVFLKLTITKSSLTLALNILLYIHKHYLLYNSPLNAP